MEMFDGGGVDTYEAILGTFDAAVGTCRLSGEDTNALRLGGHDHLRHMVARSIGVRTA